MRSCRSEGPRGGSRPLRVPSPFHCFVPPSCTCREESHQHGAWYERDERGLPLSTAEPLGYLLGGRRRLLPAIRVARSGRAHWPVPLLFFFATRPLPSASLRGQRFFTPSCLTFSGRRAIRGDL